MEKYSIKTSGQHMLSFNGDCQVEIAKGIKVEIVDQPTKATNLIMNVGAGAEVDYIVLENSHSSSTTSRQINLETKAFLDFKIIVLNQGVTKENINVDLNGEYAEANYKLVTVANENVETNVEIKVNNNAPFTKADIWQKGVVSALGTVNFQASGHIAKGSQKAESFQESKILLLDSAARGEASPLLLIDHFDVLAGHKATVSRVEDEALYYLNTRGINTVDAEKLMIKAFIAPLIDNINNQKVKIEFENKIKALLAYE